MQTYTFKEYKAEWLTKISENKDNDDKDNDPIEVKFYKNNNYQYTKIKNDYRTQDDKFMLLEWFEIDNKTVFIFNEEHGQIGIFNADTGDIIHSTKNNDIFISDYKFFDNKQYLYIAGWFWNPLPVREIYDVQKMLNTPDYDPIPIPCIDTEDYIPEISLFGCSTCKEFLEKEKDIFEQLGQKYQLEEFNKNRTGDILLKKFLESKTVLFHDDSKDILNKILLSDRTKFYTYTYGGNSGEKLGYNYALYQKIRYVTHNNLNAGFEFDELSFLVSNMLFNYIDGLPFKEIHLIFKMFSDLGDLKIVIKHTLVGNPEHRENLKSSGCSDEYIAYIGDRYKIDKVPMEIEVFSVS